MTPDQMNPDICPSALEEDGTLDRSKWDGAHVWSEPESEENIKGWLGIMLEQNASVEQVYETLSWKMGVATVCHECGAVKD